MNESFQDPERLDLPSASAMEIIVACPGMNNLKRKLPPEALVESKSDDDREWAERGTRIHHAFETGNTLELNAEENETYQTGLKYLESIKQKWISDLGLDPSKVVEGPRELRVFLTKPYDFPKLMGSAMTDRHFVYRNGDRCCLLVCDLKAGWNPNLPPSSRSWQLAYELITLYKEEYDGVTDGRVAYVKAKDKCERGDYADYSEMDLKFRYDSIVFHSWMAGQPDAPRHAGEHCRWCPCKAHCVEALAMALLPSTIAAGVLSGQKPEVAAQAVSDDDLYRLWSVSSTIEAILDAVKARLKAKTDEELAAMGLRKGKGRDTLEWNVEGAFKFLRDEKLWPEADIFKAMEFGIGKLGQLAVKQIGIDEKYANKEAKEMLAKFWMATEGEKIIRKLK